MGLANLRLRVTDAGVPLRFLRFKVLSGIANVMKDVVYPAMYTRETKIRYLWIR